MGTAAPLAAVLGATVGVAFVFSARAFVALLGFARGLLFWGEAVAEARALVGEVEVLRFWSIFCGWFFCAGAFCGWFFCAWVRLGLGSIDLKWSSAFWLRERVLGGALLILCKMPKNTSALRAPHKKSGINCILISGFLGV